MRSGDLKLWVTSRPWGGGGEGDGGGGGGDGSGIGQKTQFLFILRHRGAVPVQSLKASGNSMPTAKERLRQKHCLAAERERREESGG